MEEFLKAGKQTEITTKIMEIANSIEGSDFEFVIKLLKWLNKNVKYPAPNGIEKNDIFRSRTADQIISDGFATGCTDFTLAFIAVARAKGIPTKYIEVISKDYFIDAPDKVRGHVFAESFIKNDWWGVDPMNGFLKFNTKYPNYVVYAKGLDSWDLGIYDMKSIREKFKQFAIEYNNKNILKH